MGRLELDQFDQNEKNLLKVSLSVLIEMIVQRTYHELSILAELLPRQLDLDLCSLIFGCVQNLDYRKTDMERKIEIFNFASRTRMLLVRLLALVRWASSASKVNLFVILSLMHCFRVIKLMV